MTAVSNEVRGTLGARASLWFSLVLALLLGALSGLVLYPAAQHLRSLDDGRTVRATMRTNGPCMTGGCLVRFEAEGRTVVAELPVGSSGKVRAGDGVDVRYRADAPRTVARAQDTGGGGAMVFTVASGAAALVFAFLAAWSAFLLWRRRRLAE
ncbi:hypothetical protein [Streptomyces sp. NPDC001744]|uniref:hypothetical protein n=1 Tax=Streptomyces sp. NPDC001744 TaxID=3364606 RepID=UPI003682C6E0